jgi:cytochrome o ubiquinol oxidase subunit 3
MNAATTPVAEAGMSISERGPSPRTVIVGYGFWLFLLSDIILFSALFAAYAVLSGRTADGPSGALLFHRDSVLIETGCLLLSSFTCAMMSLAIEFRRKDWMLLGAGLTLALGAAFLWLELTELGAMLAHGAGPDRSAFLSAFFALIGCHGLHVSAGLLWLLTMMAQVYAKGYRADIRRRLLCFALFWHTLDIIWVALFSLVYLVGVAPR